MREERNREQVCERESEDERMWTRGEEKNGVEDREKKRKEAGIE